MLDATPLLRLYAAARTRRMARQDAAETQQEQLLRLVRQARHTRFGREHGFERIDSVAAYQKQVPIRRYEDFWYEYWKDPFPRIQDVTWPGLIPYVAATSGTSAGKTKYIPVSKPMVTANNRAVLDLLSFHLRNRPNSRVLGGKSFMLGGSSELTKLSAGVYSGDLSGIAAREVPRWARARYFPPPSLTGIGDWEEKMDRLGRLSLREDIRTIGGTSNWLLLFLERLHAFRPETAGRIADFYPNLELVVYGGVNFAPYRRRFEKLLQGSHAELREVYPASEGFVAIADRGPGEGLRLLPDRGVFFEFVPVDELDAEAPGRHWVATIEPEINYAVVVSTCAGAWSYILGDTVRFVERQPARLLITGRTSYFLSAFGEHLTGEEIERAVAAAAEEIGRAVTDFSVGAIFPESSPGGHLFIVEFAGALPEHAWLRTFSQRVDAHLSELNLDYKDHRAGGLGMDPPQVEPATEGTFAAWMKQQGKLGGQNKVPRVLHDGERLEDLRRFARDFALRHH